jgi:hypothetical protein
VLVEQKLLQRREIAERKAGINEKEIAHDLLLAND